MKQTDVTRNWHLLEERQAFSQSKLWDMQRSYFEQRGASAWGEGEVPQYVTSSPTIGHAYASVVFAFYQDRQCQQADSQPLTICELGAGSGALAFQFLRHLVQLCEQADVPTSAFRYVLTDFTQVNVDAWRRHSYFQTWLESGLLDLALFDINSTDTLHLQVSDTTINAGQLAQPLIVLANYVFDGVPQELILLKDGVPHDCLLSLATETDPDTLDDASLIEQLSLRYDYEPRDTLHADAAIVSLIGLYQRMSKDGHVLLPHLALRALTRLKQLSQSGMFLLSADRGSHEQEKAVNASAPGLSIHGSFALCVNYHAFFAWCHAQGGVTMAPGAAHTYIDVVGLLLADEPARYTATRDAYERHIGQSGPDAFYVMADALQAKAGALPLDALLDLLRASRYDAHQLANLMPHLLALAPTMPQPDKDALLDVVNACWSAYFPLREERDLAFEIGCLMQALNDFGAALRYFERSRFSYGIQIDTLVKAAQCHIELGQIALARRLLSQAMRIDSTNMPARALLAQLSSTQPAILS